MCNLRRFLERLTTFDPKLAPNKAFLGAAEIISLGHKISSEGVGPDPDKAKAIKEMPMPQNVSQLRSLLGGQPLTTQLPATKRSQVRVLTASIAHRPRNVDNFSSPHVLAFPDLEATISGSVPAG